MRPLGSENLRQTLAWFLFPLVPVVLGRTYHETFNLAILQGSGPDPRDWTGLEWTILIGPLIGYGFLAGATTLLDDGPGGRGPRAWLARRSAWVAVGPWVGFLVLGGLFLLIAWTVAQVHRLWPRTQQWSLPLPSDWAQTWWGEALTWVVTAVGIAALGYGWLAVAVAAIRRGRAAGRGLRVIERGVGAALAFVGSLFGSFWAITEIWRSYFFDRTIVPLVLIVLAVTAVAGGCSVPLTYGEQRRRELFSAMLAALLLGLALAWRWWGRRRPRG